MAEATRGEEFRKKPSFLDDELAPSQNEEENENETEKSSSEREKVLSKKEDLLRNIVKSRTEKSDAFTKMKNDDEEQLFQKSIHSSSSMKTSFGSAFIKDIMNNFKYPRLLTRMKIIGFIEIIFFLAINVVYVILIQSRLNDFQTNINKMVHSGSLTESFTKALSDQNLKYLLEQKVIRNVEDFDLNILNSLNNGSYENFRDFLYFRLENQFLSLFHLNKQEVIRFQDGIKEINTLDEFSLYDLLLKSFERVRSSQKKAGMGVEIVDFDEYLFLRANFFKTSVTNEFLIGLYLGIGDGDKDSVESFYLIISIAGLSVAIILQLLNLPFLSSYFHHA